MTSIIVFIAVIIMAIFTGINVYKIINSCVTYKKYYPYRKLVMVTLISLPWIFLVFPFTLDWSTYIVSADRLGYIGSCGHDTFLAEVVYVLIVFV